MLLIAVGRHLGALPIDHAWCQQPIPCILMMRQVVAQETFVVMHHYVVVLQGSTLVIIRSLLLIIRSLLLCT